MKRAGVPLVGTHGIRHRAATDIANASIPIKVGMTLTAHKTVAMFMRYVHAEDDQIRAAADAVASRRSAMVGRFLRGAEDSICEANMGANDVMEQLDNEPVSDQRKPPGFEDGNYVSQTRLGNYRPFRHRRGKNRPIPPGTKRY